MSYVQNTMLHLSRKSQQMDEECLGFQENYNLGRKILKNYNKGEKNHSLANSVRVNQR